MPSLPSPNQSSPGQQPVPSDLAARFLQSELPITPLNAPSSPGELIVTPPSLPPAGRADYSTSSPEAVTLDKADELSADAAPEGQWWFDGTAESHEDWFIDLRGNKTDHLPDVRAYLIAIGSAQHPPEDRLTPEQKDDWRLWRGKQLLLEHWRLGEGYFIDPNAPGRDYSRVRQTESVPGMGVPWYWDLRATLDRAKDEHALIPEYGDVGIRYDPLPGRGRKDDPDLIYRGPPRAIQKPLIKTNLRAPLPWQQYTMYRPGDAKWTDFICNLYSLKVHPAADALATRTPNDALDCDIQKYSQLDGRDFLTIDWPARFKDYPTYR